MWQTVNFKPWSQTKSFLCLCDCVCVQTLTGTRSSPQSHFHALRAASASRKPIRKDGGSLQKDQRKKKDEGTPLPRVSAVSSIRRTSERRWSAACAFLDGQSRGGTQIKELLLSFYPSISGCERRRGWNERERKRGGRSVHERRKDLGGFSGSERWHPAAFTLHIRGRTSVHARSITEIDRSEGVRRDESVELSMLLMRIYFKQTNKHNVNK